MILQEPASERGGAAEASGTKASRKTGTEAARSSKKRSVKSIASELWKGTKLGKQQRDGLLRFERHGAVRFTAAEDKHGRKRRLRVLRVHRFSVPWGPMHPESPVGLAQNDPVVAQNSGAGNSIPQPGRRRFSVPRLAAEQNPPRARPRGRTRAPPLQDPCPEMNNEQLVEGELQGVDDRILRERVSAKENSPERKSGVTRAVL